MCTYLSAFISHKYYFRPRARTSEEKAKETAAKRQRLAEERVLARQQGWRLVDQKVECFIRNGPAPIDAFAKPRLRTGSSLLQIFLRFISKDIVEDWILGVDDQDRILYERHNNSVVSLCCPFKGLSIPHRCLHASQ